MQVEIRPLPEKKWHGKTGKDSFAQPKTVQALVDGKSFKYVTGLTEEEAENYGKKLGVSLSDTFTPDTPHPFWDSKAGEIKLENRTKFYNTVNPIEFVKVKLLKASKFVANNQKDYDNGLYPEATHIIFDEAEDVDAKATKVQIKRKANDILNKMSKDDKINIALLLSDKSLKGKSDNFVDVELDNIIENKTAEFLKFAQMGREEISIRASVLEMIMKGKLTKDAGGIYYMGEFLGMDLDATVLWFKDPRNSQLRASLLESLNG